MVKLNSVQRRALRALMAVEWEDDLVGWMRSPGSDLRGLSARQLAGCVDEFEGLGLARVDRRGDGSVHVFLTSSAESYFSDSKTEVAKACARFAGQLLVGASGGLVVFVLARALGA